MSELFPCYSKRLPSHISVFFRFGGLYFKIIQCPKHWWNEKSFQLAKESLTDDWIQLLIVKKHEMFQAVTSFGSLRNHLQSSTRKNCVPCCCLMIVIAWLQLHLIILILLSLFMYFVQLSFSFSNNTTNLHWGVEVNNSNSTFKEKKIVTIHVLLERRNWWAK